MTTRSASDDDVVVVESTTSTRKHLVLIGGGHAHVQVIKALNHASRPACLDVTLIDMQKSASYSGMVPGCIAKLYTQEQTSLHLEPLAEWASIEFICDQVVDIDLNEKCIYLKDDVSEKRISFDVVSLDIGSASRGLNDIPGARKYSIPTRPISDLVRRIEDAEKEIVSTEAKQDVHVVVVGGGAAGIELALCLQARWKPLFADSQQDKFRVTLLDAGTELLPNENARVRRAIKKIFDDRGIEINHACKVDRVTKDELVLDCNKQIPYTHCLWAVGAEAHPLAFTLKQRGLAVSDRGWIRVDRHLQSVSHPFVFAAGDCATMENLPHGQTTPPKAGVYAVRAGPILIENLTNYLSGKDLVPFAPQKDFLKLLACGDGTALGYKHGCPVHGHWVWKLKDKIDQGFMNLFREENLPDLKDNTPYDKSQFDAKSIWNWLRPWESHCDDA